jgi:hypothetical protein
MGLDLPTEIITGVGDLNHWSLWGVDASAYSQHLDPPLLMALDGLTRQIFHPLLISELGWPQEMAERYVVWRDITGLRASPNKVPDAIQLYDRGIIGAAAVRRIAGYDETDAPGGDEAAGPTPSPSDPPRQVEGPPAEGESPMVAAAVPAPIVAWGLADIDGGLLGRLSEATRQAMRRALDRAGARARNRLRGAADLRLVAEGLPNRDLCRHLGRSTVIERLQLAEADLVTEEDFADLGDDARALLDRAVSASAEESEALGGSLERDASEEQAAVDAAVASLVAAAMAATVARLFTDDGGPDPAETGEIGDPEALDPASILDAMTVAGGGLAGTIAAGADYEVGVGNGRRATAWLRAGGLQIIAHRWVYGDRSARAANYEPHLRLDAVEVRRWDDARLRIPGSWPRGGYYRPQDHRGCLCRAAKVLWRPLL